MERNGPRIKLHVRVRVGNRTQSYCSLAYTGDGMEEHTHNSLSPFVRSSTANKRPRLSGSSFFDQMSAANSVVFQNSDYAFKQFLVLVSPYMKLGDLSKLILSQYKNMYPYER